MELYCKEFVFFDWEDRLEGKKGFFGDSINHIKQNVKDNCTMWFGEICHNVNTNTDYPFSFIDESGTSHCFRFCYYDPYYEFRKAYLEGKQLQFKDGNDWEDVLGEPCFISDEYRIKPEIMWHVVLSDEGTFGIAKSTNKSIYFTSNDIEECNKWIDEHEKFIGTMRAWEEGKTIQFLENSTGNWIDVANGIPLWGPNSTYRVKPDECEDCMKYNYCTNKDGKRCKSYCTKVEYVPFDTVEGLIEAWDNKYPQNKNRPEGTMPLIWIKNKQKNRVYLITDFLFDKYFNDDVGTESDNFQLKELFENFTFLDGSVIGKVKEEE